MATWSRGRSKPGKPVPLCGRFGADTHDYSLPVSQRQNGRQLRLPLVSPGIHLRQGGVIRARMTDELPLSSGRKRGKHITGSRDSQLTGVKGAPAWDRLYVVRPQPGNRTPRQPIQSLKHDRPCGPDASLRRRKHRTPDTPNLQSMSNVEQRIQDDRQDVQVLMPIESEALRIRQSGLSEAPNLGQDLRFQVLAVQSPQ